MASLSPIFSSQRRDVTRHFSSVQPSERLAPLGIMWDQFRCSWNPSYNRYCVVPGSLRGPSIGSLLCQDAWTFRIEDNENSSPMEEAWRNIEEGRELSFGICRISSWEALIFWQNLNFYSKDTNENLKL